MDLILYEMTAIALANARLRQKRSRGFSKDVSLVLG
jgi:hypothetical protein